jgi:hypothetical protein
MIRETLTAQAAPFAAEATVTESSPNLAVTRHWTT